MPTIITDDFETETIGALNGQNGWSGDTLYLVENAVVKNGSQAVGYAFTTLTDTTIVKAAGADVADGNQVVYIRTTNVTNNDLNVEVLDNGGATLFNFYWRAGTATLQAADTTVTVATSLAANTWYCFEFDWQSSDHTVRARVDSGSYTARKAYNSSSTNAPRKIQLETAGDIGGGGNGTAYYDTFQQNQIATTNIKTFNGVTYANTKTVNAVAIASVKSWDGIT